MFVGAIAGVVAAAVATDAAEGVVAAAVATDAAEVFIARVLGQPTLRGESLRLLHVFRHLAHDLQG